jgi:cytosine/adenosine deaminase-related metal-dependent hydrolase
VAPDLVLREARIAGREDTLVDIAIAGGRIVDIAANIETDTATERLSGRLILPGFVETHIHLDKSCILEPDYGVAVGNPADIVVLDCQDRAIAVAELKPPMFGLKRGRRSFTRPSPRLHFPGS